MRLPPWDELESVAEQLDVLDWPLDEPLFVAGPPGSGKTVLAARRAKMMADAGLGVVVLTYNRMLRRLTTLLMESQREEEEPTTVGSEATVSTMQSYVWKDYLEKTGSRPPTPPHDHYAYIWNDMLGTLEGRGAGSNEPRLVVDEGQDLAEGFFTYASRHVSRTMSVYADDDQALSNRGTTLEQIKQAAGLPDPILLTQNHRNTPEIARLAEHFHTGRLPAAAVRRSRSGDRPRLWEAPSLEAAARRVADEHSNRGGSTGVIADQNAVGQNLHDMLRRRLPERRVDFYSNDQKNENGINVLEDGVTVLNKESVKGQEFDTVFVLELHRFLPATTEAEKTRHVHDVQSCSGQPVAGLRTERSHDANHWRRSTRTRDIGA